MKKQTWILLLLLVILITPARAAGVDKFATLDEPWWVISGSNFYYALTHREFANTAYDYHPAVTTMWVVTAGMVSYFPEYRIHAQQYYDVRKPAFENFMRAQGKDTLPLIRNARLFQVALLIALAALSFFLLQKLINEKAAFLAIALAVNSPFFMGNSRLLNHEAMLAMFSLAALLAMQVYLNKERNLVYLLISGVMFGLAQLTKSSSIVLIPLAGLILFVGLFQRGEKNWGAKFFDAAKVFILWLVVALFVYALLWPGMWVAPKKMLYEVYGNAFSYALQGGRLDVTEEIQPESFKLASDARTMYNYALQWIRFSTPLSWLGLMFAALFLFSKDEEFLRAPIRSTLVYLFALAVLFIVLFGVSQGRDSAHYILTSYVSLDALAGIGWAYLLGWTQKNWGKHSARFLPLSIAALALFQLGSAVLHFPYYYTYKNPLTERGGVHGYGEGLDLAAEYLAQKPNAHEMYVIAYAGRGCFSYFFPGRTEHMKIALEGEQPFVEDLQNADYLVVYNIRQVSKPDGVELIRVLQNTAPEKIIAFDGFEYARIYKVTELPQEIYNSLLGK